MGENASGMARNALQSLFARYTQARAFFPLRRPKNFARLHFFVELNSVRAHCQNTEGESNGPRSTASPSGPDLCPVPASEWSDSGNGRGIFKSRFLPNVWKIRQEPNKPNRTEETGKRNASPLQRKITNMASKTFLAIRSSRAIAGMIATGEKHDNSIVIGAYTLAIDALARAGRDMNAGEWDGEAKRKDKVFSNAVHDARIETILSGVAIFRDTQGTLNTIMHGRNSPELQIKGVQMYLAGCKGLKTVGRFDQAQTIGKNIYNKLVGNDADTAKDFANMSDTDEAFDAAIADLTEKFGTTYAEVRDNSDPAKKIVPKKSIREKTEALFADVMDPAEFDRAITFLQERRKEVAKAVAEAANRAEAENLRMIEARAEAEREAAEIAAIAAAAKAEQEAAKTKVEEKELLAA